MAKVIYGYLYNYWAAVDSRLPNGDDYRFPTKAELTGVDGLTGYINTEYNVDPDDFGIGNHLKSCRQDGSPLGGECDTTTDPYWAEHSTEYGRDTVNFGGVGGSSRGSDGGWPTLAQFRVRYVGRIWHVSTHWSSANGEAASLSNSTSTVAGNTFNRANGFSVRLIRDATVSEQAEDDGTILTDDYTGNDGKKYDGVKIDDKIWLATNLAETEFDDDTDIPNVTANADWADLSTEGDPGRCAYNNDESYAVAPPEAGAEATINISAEASKENVNIQLGESGTVNVLAEGSAVNGIPVSGEATISIAAEGAATGGDTGVQAGASATINIVSESGQTKSTDVGSSATINVLSEAVASKGADKDSEATISISAEADKVKGVSVGAESTINIVSEGAATAEEPPRQASAEATINVLAQAAGTKITGVSSEALIEIIAEALGEKSVNREAQALIDIFSEADKVKGTQLGSDSTILISAEAEATTEILIHVGAEAIIDISAEAEAVKSINKDSEAVVSILAQAASFKLSPLQLVAISIGSLDGLLTLEVTVEGGDQIYEYSIDNVDWQASNTFTGLTAGTYTVYVRDGQEPALTDQLTVSLTEVAPAIIPYTLKQRFLVTDKLNSTISNCDVKIKIGSKVYGGKTNYLGVLEIQASQRINIEGTQFKIQELNGSWSDVAVVNSNGDLKIGTTVRAKTQYQTPLPDLKTEKHERY